MTSESNPPNVLHEVLFDGYVNLFVLTNMTRETVDTWIDICDKIMAEGVQKNAPIFIIQDLSHPDATQTPYSQSRGQALVDAYPDLQGYIAFVLQDNADSQRIRLFVKRQNNRYRQREVFFTREDALEWIEGILIRKKLINTL